MKILYGILDNSIDVTDICIEKLNQNNIITIPYGDENRASVFTDPLFGIVKQVIIENDGIITEYDIFTQIKINTLNNQVTVTNENDINNKIAQIHSNLKIEYGSILYELPEQKMVVRYLTGKEKVLEIGANIGRNSLVIASILGNDNQRNFVSLESDINIANQLTHNRELNNFNFHIESSALSNRKLIQKGWDTKPSETLEEGFTLVKTITLAELKNKYNIDFDTLVLDCEGAFYYILMDMPELLNNINLIIMENDYWEIDKKNYIDDILKQNNFYVDYVESGGWGPCYSNFFEVWKKMC
jgi:FkbM family methyltransferase